MSKLKYGEFSFPTPTARPSVSGYARGGKAPTKGQAKVAKVMGEFKRGDLHSGSAKGPIVKSPKQAIAIALSEKKAAGYKDGGNAKKGEKSAKLVGMKREPEAIVKKEVALLKKAGAPAKIIKHEEREMTLPEGLKKGGKPKYQEGGYNPPSENTFREREGKFFHNNEEISRDEFVKRKQAVDDRMRQIRGPDRRGMSFRDRAKAAMGDLDTETKDSFEMIQKREQRPYKKGGYADGGDVRQMVKENAKAKNAAPAKRPMTDRERMMMEEARGQKMDRQMRDAERQHYERERMENEADRRAMQDALMYIPRKIGEGARSAYDAVRNSDVAKGMRNYGRSYQEGLGMKPDTPYEKKKGGAVHSDVAMDKKIVKKAVHKHEAAMHPGKPMTKLKKGGQPKKLEVGGYMAAPQAPASPAGSAPTGSAPNAMSQMGSIAQKYAAQAAAARPAGNYSQGVANLQRPPGGAPAGAAPNASSLLSNVSRGIAAAPAYASQSGMNRAPAPSPLSSIARGMSRNPAPGGRFPAPPANQAGAAAAAAGKVPAYATQSAAPAMKRGGAAKKGVPVHSRTPKC